MLCNTSPGTAAIMAQATKPFAPLCAQALASQFEQLALGPGQNPTPGQPPDSGPDIAGFPRPLGADAAACDAPATVDPHSCDPAYLRPTTTVFPGTQTVRARCVPLSRERTLLQDRLFSS